MKKLILLSALSLFLILGFAASSQAQDTTFHPHGAVNGQLFMDYYYMMNADTTTGSATGKPGPYGKGNYEPNSNISATANTRYYNAFDIRRTYLGYNYWFSPGVNAGVLLSHENGAGGNGDVLLDKNYGLFLKNAYLQFTNAVPMAKLTIGQQGTPTFAIDEAVWGYRSIEKTIMDFRGMATSTDLGIQLAGNFDNDKMFGYAAMISNGGGNADPTTKYKKFTVDLNASLLDHHIIVDIAADDQEVAWVPGSFTVADPNAPVDSTKASGVTKTNTTFKGFVAYTSDPITVGVVYAMRTLGGQSLEVAGNDDDQQGISFFAHAQIIPKTLNIFARYDMWDPDTKATDNIAGRKENFITAGLDWLPDMDDQNVHVMPNIWIDSFSDKSSAGTDYESIMVGRLTFSYKF